MRANKPDTSTFSADSLGETDLAKLDAYALQPSDYEELPELDDATVARSVPGDGTELLRRRGRPRAERTKQLVALRLDPDVVAAFRSTGAGWQTRINAVLLEAARKLPRP